MIYTLQHAGIKEKNLREIELRLDNPTSNQANEIRTAHEPNEQRKSNEEKMSMGNGGKLTLKELLERVTKIQEQSEDVPQSYLDRLNTGKDLLDEYNKLQASDWSNLTLDNPKVLEENLEKAEAQTGMKVELISRIRQHFTACSYLVKPEEATGKKTRKASGTRQPRRSKEQQEYDTKYAELRKQVKAKLELPARGRLTEDQQKKLDAEMEKEVKRQKLVPPKAE